MRGTIKKIVRDKGFGFIVPDDGSDDVFFHRSRLGPKMQFEDLREGDEVEFHVKPGDKGPQAFDVRVRERGTSSRSGSSRRSAIVHSAPL